MASDDAHIRDSERGDTIGKLARDHTSLYSNGTGGGRRPELALFRKNTLFCGAAHEANKEQNAIGFRLNWLWCRRMGHPWGRRSACGGLEPDNPEGHRQGGHYGLRAQSG